jgi:glycosyltransferase involved in cell wall biosynthesis
MKLCIVIPAHNEANTIGSLVAGLKKIGQDVVVIDDGSSDQSGEMARTQGAVVLRNEIKRGKGFSLQRGFAHALQNDYSGVIVMDGDGQHAVTDIPKFVTTIEQSPASIITGNRMSDPQGMPWLRRLTNRVMSALISQICQQPIPDTQCGYRYISREILSRLRLTSQDFEIETEVLIQASRLGYRIFSVPVQTIYRDERSKISPLKDTCRFFIYLGKEMTRGIVRK